MPKVKKIDKGEAIIIVGTAAFCDLVELILVFTGLEEAFGWFVGPAKYLIFALWFLLHGSFFFMQKKGRNKNPQPDLVKDKKLNLTISPQMIIGMILETIPIGIPAFTVNVYKQIIEVNRCAAELEMANQGEDNTNIIRFSRPEQQKQQSAQEQQNQPAKQQNQDKSRPENSNVIRFRRPTPTTENQNRKAA